MWCSRQWNAEGVVCYEINLRRSFCLKYIANKKLELKIKFFIVVVKESAADCNPASTLLVFWASMTKKFIVQTCNLFCPGHAG